MSRSIGVAALVAAIALMATPARADQRFRVEVTQLDASGFPDVRLTALVVDEQRRPVRGLTPANLIVREDGEVRQTRIELARATPVLLVLVLDTSGSMAGRPIADSREALAALVGTLRPEDQAALVTFSTTVEFAQPATADKSLVAAAARRATSGGDTALYDAVVRASELVRQAPAALRRGLVLLTDGVDNASRSSRADALRAVSDAGFPVYIVGLGSTVDWPTLRALADASRGGQVIPAPTSAALAEIYAGLSSQILTQYTIAYRSSAQGVPGSSIKLRLQVIRGGDLLAETTASYRMPDLATSLEPTPLATPIPAGVQPRATEAPAMAAEEPAMPPEIVALLGAASILTLLLWLWEVATRWPRRESRRLAAFVEGFTVTAPEQTKRRSIVQRLVAPSLRTVGRPILRITPSVVVNATRARLEQAGEPMSLAPAEFIGVRFGVAITGAIVAIAIALTAKADLTVALAMAAPSSLLGYTIPGLVLEGRVRVRQSAIRKALPAALDMLALSVEAGLSFDGAIAQVAQRWDTPLSDEFRRLLLQFQMGRDRRQALRELGGRAGVPELLRFVTAVIQADAFGAPLSKVLHEQAFEIRTRRRQRAEELARTAPVKMLFPMVLLIFPALFVVILGPAVPRLLAIFSVGH